MTFWRFLHDHVLHIGVWAMGLGLLDLILWLDPNYHIVPLNILYMNLILTICLFLFLASLYLYRRSWYQELEQKIADGHTIFEQPLKNKSSYTQQLVANYARAARQSHRQSVDELVREQNDQKEFLDTWIHDIKVPLAALQLIADDIMPDIADERYLAITQELSKINQDVEKVLYYSRLTHFANDYLIQEYSLAQIVNAVVKNNMNLFIHKKITLTTNALNVSVLTDEKWLGFILQQLIMNALTYTPKGGTITIETHQEHQGIALIVQDNGLGIPPEDLPRIFDKGFTGRNGRLSNQHATGLGLYLAQHLCQKLGHQLTAASVEDKGTTMALHFPYLSYYNEAGSHHRFTTKENTII